MRFFRGLLALGLGVLSSLPIGWLNYFADAGPWGPGVGLFLSALGEELVKLLFLAPLVWRNPSWAPGLGGLVWTGFALTELVLNLVHGYDLSWGIFVPLVLHPCLGILWGKGLWTQKKSVLTPEPLLYHFSYNLLIAGGILWASFLPVVLALVRTLVSGETKKGVFLFRGKTT